MQCEFRYLAGGAWFYDKKKNRKLEYYTYLLAAFFVELCHTGTHSLMGVIVR